MCWNDQLAAAQELVGRLYTETETEEQLFNYSELAAFPSILDRASTSTDIN